MRVFCKACEARLRTVITSRIGVTLEPRVEIDTQRRLFDAIAWQDRAELPMVSTSLVSTAKTTGPLWSCAVDFSGGSFRFTDVNLSNVDYWSAPVPPHVAHVLQSVAFEGLELKFTDGTTRPLALTDALASATMPPKFAVSLQGDARGRYQLGACLTLSWLVTHSPRHSCVAEAKLSLVLANMDNDLDPAGIMVGCRLYPQIAMRVHSLTPGTRAVKSLHGTVTLAANNADPGPFSQPLNGILNGRLTASLFCESNRAATDARKRPGLRTAMVPGMESLLPVPHWSRVYDYVNVDASGMVKVTAANARSDGALGTAAREKTKTWPAGQATAETVHKLPRQGAYDSLCIHPDLGTDANGQPIIAAPICADFALHMHWRRGASWAGDRPHATFSAAGARAGWRREPHGPRRARRAAQSACRRRADTGRKPIDGDAEVFGDRDGNIGRALERLPGTGPGVRLPVRDRRRGPMADPQPVVWRAGVAGRGRRCRQPGRRPPAAEVAGWPGQSARCRDAHAVELHQATAALLRSGTGRLDGTAGSRWSVRPGDAREPVMQPSTPIQPRRVVSADPEWPR